MIAALVRRAGAVLHEALRQAIHNAPEVLRRDAIGLILVACSAVVIAALDVAEVPLSTPKPLSVADAVAAAVRSGPLAYVTVDGPVDLTNKFYNIPSAIGGVGFQFELASRFSPADGIPVSGPGSLVPPHYYGDFLNDTMFHTRIRFVGPLTPDTYADEFHGLRRTRIYQSKLANGYRPFTVVTRFSQPIWNFIDYDERFSQQYKAWLDQGQWTGVVKDYGFTIDTNAPLSHDGMYFYMPFRDSNQKVWLRVPIDLTGWDKNGTKFTGLFMPPRTHPFELENDDSVAAVSLDPVEIRAFLDKQWRTVWSVTEMLSALLAIAGLVFIGVIEGRRLLFKPSMPDYLVPFASYLLPEPVNRSFTIAAIGAVMIVFGGLVALFSFGTAYSIFKAFTNAPNNGSWEDFWYFVSALVVGGFSLTFYKMGRGIWSRGATQILENDKRHPVVYLRSFRSDNRREDTEQKFAETASKFGPVVAVGEPGERFPPFGAARLYIDHAHWHDVVAALVATAQLIVFRVADTPGFWWELQHVLERIDPGKVLIWVPAGDQWRFDRTFASRVNAMLPRPLPPPAQRAHNATFAAFGPDWTPEWIKAIPGTE